MRLRLPCTFLSICVDQQYLITTVQKVPQSTCELQYAGCYMLANGRMIGIKLQVIAGGFQTEGVIMGI